jgi:hypothetical protein
MTREYHVRFREGGRVRFPSATRPVMAFADFQDGKRVLDVLGKRLARYELTLHPDKTRFVDFRSNRPDGKDHPDTDGTTFTFLGFCHVWGKSRKGKNVVRQVTAKKRYAPRAGGGQRLVSDTPTSVDPRAACPTGCEDAGPLCLLRYIGQPSTTQLVRPQGCEDLAQMAVATREPVPMGSVQRPPNAAPSASSSDRPPLHRCERISPVRNRMLEIGTSGTVRGEAGNILTYSAPSEAGDLSLSHPPFGSISRRNLALPGMLESNAITQGEAVMRTLLLAGVSAVVGFAIATPISIAPASAQVAVDTPMGGVRVGPERRYYRDYDRPAYRA